MSTVSMDTKKSFVVKEYGIAPSSTTPPPVRDVRVVDLDGLMNEVDIARGNKEKKIAVFVVGRCILDWT